MGSPPFQDGALGHSAISPDSCGLPRVLLYFKLWCPLRSRLVAEVKLPLYLRGGGSTPPPPNQNYRTSEQMNSESYRKPVTPEVYLHLLLLNLAEKVGFE